MREEEEVESNSGQPKRDSGWRMCLLLAFTANITTDEAFEERQHKHSIAEASPLPSPHKGSVAPAHWPPKSRVVTSTRNLLRLKTKVSKF